MKMFIVVLVCVGLGYAAEIYYQNPQDYIVWGGFSVISFGAYLYLTQVTSVAFALPVTAVLIGAASVVAYTEGERGLLIVGIYGSIGALILLGDRFLHWRWADWKSPVKFFKALSGRRWEND